MKAKAPMKSFSYGGGVISKISPEKASIGPETKAINLTLTFEESLKLSLAVDECVRQLNKYKRSTKAGKQVGMNLTVYLSEDVSKVIISERKILKND